VKKNIELKARFRDLEAARAVMRAIGAPLHACERQEDTYFRSARGRLKLRRRWRVDPASPRGTAARGPEEPAQLIWYERADEAAARPSEYLLAAHGEGERLLDLLSSALEARAVVRKDREVYLHDQVRVHLDLVEGLGTFLELEAIVEAEGDEEAARGRLEKLRGALGIVPEMLVQVSYSDLLLSRDSQAGPSSRSDKG
jgi:adenylate cyclase, class 2